MAYSLCNAPSASLAGITILSERHVSQVILIQELRRFRQPSFICLLPHSTSRAWSAGTRSGKAISAPHPASTVYPSMDRRFSLFAVSPGCGERQRPTRDLMRLYTKMRDLQSELTLNELLNWRETPAYTTHQLLPPTPGTTTMSRSTPQVSSCSESVNQAPGGLEITSSPSSDDAHKRIGRHGPLTEFAKARTAFVRKLKACADCRNRKVQVS